MKKTMPGSASVFLALCLLLTHPAVCCADTPADSILSRLCDSVNICLESPARYAEARSLLDEGLSMKDADRSGFFPMLRYLETTYYIYIGEGTLAKRQLQQLQRQLPFASQPELSISVPQDLGVLCRREGKTDSALYYYGRALEAAIAQDDAEWMASINLNIGVLYSNLARYGDAEPYIDKAVTLADGIDDAYTCLCAYQLQGHLKLNLQKYADAERAIRKALPMAEASESADWQLRCLTTMVALFDYQYLTDSAQAYVNRGNALLPQLPPQSITAVGYVMARANHYYITGQWQQALDDYLVMRAAGMGTGEQNVFDRMARCYEQLGRWHEAYCYMDSARQRSDTLATEAMAAQIAEFQAKYQTMEKDLEIARLQTQRTWLAALAVAVVLLIAGLLLWLRQRRQRREAQMRIQTLEDERQRIARELHDGLCNDMLALEMQMQFADSHSMPTLQERLHAMRHQARELSHQLMPPEFTHLSLPRLLRLYAEAMQKGTTAAVAFDCTPDDDDYWLRMAHPAAHGVYRIVQEHTANILKGGTATRLHISLQGGNDNSGRLTIADDGRPTPSQGLGTRTLNDRVLSVGGKIQKQNSDGMNRLVLDFPVC